MATDDVKQRAREVLSDLACRGNHLVLQYFMGSVGETVDALSAAGLLRTDLPAKGSLAERALEACKWARKTVWVATEHWEQDSWHPSLAEVFEVGREALAAEKQREGPWVAC